MIDLPPFQVPKGTNYIAAFLTFACQLRCPYCINHHGGNLVKKRRMTGHDWIKAINRLEGQWDIPVTLQGGEPTVHKDFFEILNGIRGERHIDILTNLEVDPGEFIRGVDPNRLRREAPYASIRVSYHHGQSQFKELLSRVKTLALAGFHIGIWEVDHPEYHEAVLRRQEQAKSVGIDYRLKEFLGPWRGVNHGTFKYPNAVNDKHLRWCDCRTSEILMAPDGYFFRCHSDLYANRSPIGHVLDSALASSFDAWRPCRVMGKCNSCDVKVTTNRNQQFGHTSVEISHIQEPYALNDEYIQEVVNTYGKQDKKPVDDSVGKW